MKAFILIALTNMALGSVLLPRDNKSPEHKRIAGIITKIFYEELYEKTKHLKPEVEVKKAKISLNDGRRGKMIIEMLKQKNRERIALMRGLDPRKATSGKALVQQQQNKNRSLIKKMRAQELMLSKKYAHLPIMKRKRMIWQEQARIEMKQIKDTVARQRGWKKKHKGILDVWKKENGKFLGRVEEYREALSKIPLILPISKSDSKKKVEVEIVRDHIIVPGSLELKIRDQGRRPTCSAFAGIRAIEVLLSQNEKQRDLSEQYFYWSSKPKCRQRKCANKGSWVGYGMDFSRDGGALNIPLETSCPYKNSSINNNDTQIPMASRCSKGLVKVKEYKYYKTLDQVINSLKNNKPIIAGFKLSPNFYKTKGLVLDSESKMAGATDSHSKGHAVLLIGYLKLPKVLNEGKVCLITANSWGKGWGHGGYGCLSEKWILNHRQGNPFVALNSVEI